MRILFDQGTPVPLRRALAEHEVRTAYEEGWATLENSELLDAADGVFDLLITTDKNLRLQKLCDVAEFLRVHPDLDWDLLAERARSLGSERLLWFSVGITDGILGPVLSDEVRRMARAAVLKQFFAEDMRRGREGAVGVAVFLCERGGDVVLAFRMRHGCAGL